MIENMLKIMELSCDKDYTKTDIKRQFHILAKKYHPDTGGDVEKFKLVKENYDKINEIKGELVYKFVATERSDRFAERFGFTKAPKKKPKPKTIETKTYNKTLNWENPVIFIDRFEENMVTLTTCKNINVNCTFNSGPIKEKFRIFIPFGQKIPVMIEVTVLNYLPFKVHILSGYFDS